MNVLAAPIHAKMVDRVRILMVDLPVHVLLGSLEMIALKT
jgi:hypothetical protein